MAFFDWLTGKDTGKTSGQQTTSGTQQTTQEQSQAGASTTQTGTTGSQTGQTQTTQQQQTLAPEVQAVLETLLGQASAGGGGASGDQAAAVAQSLLGRAGETQTFVDDRTAAIVDATRQEGERQVSTRNTANTRAAGSGFNTLAQQSNQQAQNELEVSLAGLEGELGLQGRELENQALAQAFDALVQSGELGAGAGLEGLRVAGQLANVLKGATTTGTAATTTETSTEEQQTSQTLQQLLTMLTSQTQTEGQTSQSGKSSQTGGILDLVPLLFTE